MHPYEQLEIEWAKFNDLDPKGMVACASGTAALHLALEAFQLPPGSEVITSDFNMIAVPRAITLAGLTPVFVDCDERLLMDIKCRDSGVRILSEYAPHALVVVHIYGRKCDVESLRGIAGTYVSIKVVEDLAEAHGVKPHPQTDAAAWSFYRNKIVAGEEGGAVWFRDPVHAEIARELRCLGFNKQHNFYHRPRGHNYRMSNLHAAWILGEISVNGAGYGGMNPNRLSRAHNLLEYRREIEGWYDEFCPDAWRMPPRDAPWIFDLLLPRTDTLSDVVLSDYVVGCLRKEGIEARCGFKPMSSQEEFNRCRRIKRCGHDKCVEEGMASVLSKRVMYLPIEPGKTTREDCRKSFELIGQILGQSAS